MSTSDNPCPHCNGAEDRIRELLQDREILHQDGERWREYGKAAIQERITLQQAVIALRDAKGRHHTQQAFNHLVSLLPADQ